MNSNKIEQSTNILTDANNAFKAWQPSPTTVKSDLDQLIWIEADQRFALLGRDIVDFKISDDWKSGVWRVIYAFSEVALLAARKISKFYYGKTASPAASFKKIDQLAKEYISKIEKIGPLEVTAYDLRNLKYTVSVFSHGLNQILPFSKTANLWEAVIGKISNKKLNDPTTNRLKLKAERTIKKLENAINSKIQEVESYRSKAIRDLKAFLPYKPNAYEVVTQSGFSYISQKVDLEKVKYFILTAKRPSELLRYFSEHVQKQVGTHNGVFTDLTQLTDKEIISYLSSWSNCALDFRYAERIAAKLSDEKRIESYCFYPKEMRQSLLKHLELFHKDVYGRLIGCGATNKGTFLGTTGQSYIYENGKIQIESECDLKEVASYIMETGSYYHEAHQLKKKISYFTEDVLRGVLEFHHQEAGPTKAHCQEALITMIANGFDLRTGKRELQQSLRFFEEAFDNTVSSVRPRSIGPKEQYYRSLVAYYSLDTLKGIFKMVVVPPEPESSRTTVTFYPSPEDLYEAECAYSGDWIRYTRSKTISSFIKQAIDQKIEAINQKNTDEMLKTLFSDRYGDLTEEQKNILISALKRS